jgi:hypothetical protein
MSPTELTRELAACIEGREQPSPAAVALAGGVVALVADRDPADRIALLSEMRALSMKYRRPYRETKGAA